MNAYPRWVVGGALVACIAGGCSRSSTSEIHAFDQAAPELKQTWMTALSAGSNNDYVGSQTMLFGLLGEPLTPEQVQAVQKEIALVRNNLSAAVQKGDPAAQAALQQLRQNPPNRQRH
jgi:hypothetical protein